jgi:hypothetical protein
MIGHGSSQPNFALELLLADILAPMMPYAVENKNKHAGRDLQTCDESVRLHREEY